MPGALSVPMPQDKKTRDEDAAGLPTSRLARLRLILAFDALLVEKSVAKAAERLNISSPAMSRLLAQIREIYQDPIVIRSGRRLIPTPLAESLRQRLRAIAAESDTLLDARAGDSPGPGPGSAPARPTVGPAPATPIQAVPLSMRPAFILEGAPDPGAMARKLASIGEAAPPQMKLAKYIALTGAGTSGSRPLTLDEADEAFSVILAGDADPIQIGAFLVVMQYRGLTAAELAGLVRASRRHCGAPGLSAAHADLDWPAYISPKSREAPWFLHAARLVAKAGHRILIHTQKKSGNHLEAAARMAGIGRCLSAGEASAQLKKDHIAVIQLDSLSTQLHGLMSLYGLFEMRSPLNVLVAMLNPLGANTSLLGVSRASYRELHRDAAAMLQWPNLAALGNSRDVAQATPFRSTTIFRLVDRLPRKLIVPSTPEPRAEPPIDLTRLEYWDAVWAGRARDDRAEEVIVSTAAAALLALKRDEMSYAETRAEAKALWRQRNAG
ncbi:glycosyl transferase [Agaricicola taiwanensis]|uniref:Glycosyl transferase n=2 Tax=Agaricicola taiwanensis TaxID=591372 RepID=A0A8J2YB84_9RHOB|nr:glycosyl transferase [Agaricicola taiwanensis]